MHINPRGAIEPAIRRGLAAFSRALESVFASWEVFHMEPEWLEVFGGRAPALVRCRARGRGSVAELEGREPALGTIRDGRVVRYERFHAPRNRFAVAREDAGPRRSPADTHAPAPNAKTPV